MLAPGASAPALPGARLVYDSHEFAARGAVPGAGLGRWWSLRSSGCSFRRCDAVITVSEGSPIGCRRCYGLRQRPIVVRNLPDPAETDPDFEAPDLRERARDRAAEAPLVLHLGAAATRSRLRDAGRGRWPRCPDAQLLFLGADDAAYVGGSGGTRRRRGGMGQRVHLRPSVPGRRDPCPHSPGDGRRLSARGHLREPPAGAAEQGLRVPRGRRAGGRQRPAGAAATPRRPPRGGPGRRQRTTAPVADALRAPDRRPLGGPNPAPSGGPRRRRTARCRLQRARSTLAARPPSAPWCSFATASPTTRGFCARPACSSRSASRRRSSGWPRAPLAWRQSRSTESGSCGSSPGGTRCGRSGAASGRGSIDPHLSSRQVTRALRRAAEAPSSRTSPGARLRTVGCDSRLLSSRGRAWCGECDPDLIHANDYNTAWIGVLGKWLTGARLVYDSHELWPDRNLRPEPRGWLLLCESLFVHVADEVITTSPGYARCWPAATGSTAPRLVRNVPAWRPSRTSTDCRASRRWRSTSAR